MAFKKYVLIKNMAQLNTNLLINKTYSMLKLYLTNNEKLLFLLCIDNLFVYLVSIINFYLFYKNYLLLPGSTINNRNRPNSICDLRKGFV